MRRIVDEQRHQQQVSRQIGWARDHVLLDEENASRPIDIVFGTPEVVDRDHHPASQRLQFPSSPVVSQPPNRPQQQCRRNHVEQTQQAHWQGQVRIEHVFSATDGVVSGEPCARQIDRVQRLKNQQADRLPREQQSTFAPERERDE